MDVFNPAHDFTKRLSFEFVLPEDIRALSVKQVNTAQVFDDLGHPHIDGLYDPAMGPIERNTKCQTCGLGAFQCTGHFGHIELAVPVYNPLTFSQLFNLLRMSCLNCHRFRGSRLRVSITIGQLKLLNAHLLLESRDLENWITNRLFTTHSGEEAANTALDHATLVDKLERYVRKLVHNIKGPSLEKSAIIEEARRTVIDEFLKKAPAGAQCQHCKAYAHSLHRHANSKVFLNPLRKNLKALNESKNISTADQLDLITAHDAKDEETVDAEEDEEVKDESAMKYLTPMHVYEHMKQIWKNECELLELLFSPQLITPDTKKRLDFRIFFSEVLAVPPCRFRPPSVFNDSQFDHPQNTYLIEILKLNQRIIDLNAQSGKMENVEENNDPNKPKSFASLVQAWVQLQEQINYLFDASRNQQPGGKIPPAGIKQILEKKEGLFRKHMMGKRVNFAARSVISPDASIETSEIGVPLVFASKLTYPEPVTTYNRYLLAQAVRNGPHVHPGATHIQYADGTVSNLEAVGPAGRQALAKEIMDLSVPKKVLRHIQTGDVVLMNRQPTLHKPSMMAHRVRVLPGEKTLRMHYANCNTYNADFDGDEMNLHFPQSELARAELYNICNTNRQYLGVTDGSPLRGLIQDHISTGVRLTVRDVFISKSEFQQLLFSSLCDLQGRIECPKPAVYVPIELYTGKQLISAVLLNLTKGSPPLNLTSKCRVSDKLWGPTASEEAVVTVVDGHLLTGICDKTQFGASAYGITHAVFELYGPDTAGRLLTCIGRLLTRYAMHAGFTCRLDDLYLTKQANDKRKELLQKVPAVGRQTASDLVHIPAEDRLGMRSGLEKLLRSEDGIRQVDGAYKGAMNKVTSQVIEACLPEGQLRSFPSNHMALMTQTGAKGSLVNFSQIAGLLGQQELEGKRVPMMASGKTLPSFPAWDARPRAGGYITQRFLTGIRPQEFFFHCMAGREGLIDTAVKTSRSGYLQRCLIKHLESCSVHYDGTVRLHDDESVVQFLYGEDGLDVTKQKYLKNLTFANDNFDSLVHKIRPDLVLDAIDTEQARKLARKISKHPERNIDPVLATFSPYTHLCAVSEKYNGALEKFVQDHPFSQGDNNLSSNNNGNNNSEKQFKALMWLRYMRSLVEPGEAVGLLAAQSIGEPSTQMTLNTFHFAGFGAKNVTLGIPRLREVIMTAASKIKTPTMTIPINPKLKGDEERISQLITHMNRQTLADVVIGVQVQEFVTCRSDFAKAVSSRRCRVYNIKLELNNSHKERKQWKLLMENDFVIRLQSAVQKHLKKTGRTKSSPSAQLDDLIQSQAEKKASSSYQSNNEKDDEESDKRTLTSKKEFDISDSDEDEDDQLDEERATLDASEAKDAMRKKQLSTYDEDDEDHAEEESEEGESEVKKKSSNDLVVDEEESEVADKFSRLAEHRNLRNLIIHLNGNGNDNNGNGIGNDHSSQSYISIDYICPADMPKLPMLDLVEDSVLKQVVVQQLVPSLTKVHYDDQSHSMSTEGVNLLGLMQACLVHDLPLEYQSLVSNDIHAILNVLGVEAARATIVSEIGSVFAVYGISVDYRHLSLIADYMTRMGTYVAFNRTGITYSSSPLLKMSFESTVSFLRTSVLTGEWDNLQGPASRLVCGLPVTSGTGSFDLLINTSTTMT